MNPLGHFDSVEVRDVIKTFSSALLSMRIFLFPLARSECAICYVPSRFCLQCAALCPLNGTSTIIKGTVSSFAHTGPVKMIKNGFYERKFYLAWDIPIYCVLL